MRQKSFIELVNKLTDQQIDIGPVTTQEQLQEWYEIECDIQAVYKQFGVKYTRNNPVKEKVTK